MPEAKMKPGKARDIHTEGAKRASPGEYYFDFGAVNEIMGGPEYSTASGGCIEGERMIAALMRMPAGTGSEPHSHPNEQWIYVLKGTVDSTVDGVHQLVQPGQVIYVPANMVHSGRATPDAEAVFFTVKDASYGLHGRKFEGGA
jgi:quercetin dioxygenase-like cupin family protein